MKIIQNKTKENKQAQAKQKHTANALYNERSYVTIVEEVCSSKMTMQSKKTMPEENENNKK